MTELRKELADLRRDKAKAKEPAIAFQIQEKNIQLKHLVEEWPTKTQVKKRKALESQAQSSSKRVRVDLTLEEDESIKDEEEEGDEDEDEDNGLELASKAYQALQWLQLDSLDLSAFS